MSTRAAPAVAAPTAIPACDPGVGWRIGALLVAVLVYGLFSAPAPAFVGWAELTVAGCLMAAVGLRQGVWFASGYRLRDPRCPPLDAVASVSFVLLLWIGLLRGAALGWSPVDMVRDIVPLCFLFLPVLLARSLARVPHETVEALAACVAVAGILLATRWWVDLQFVFRAVGAKPIADGDLYLLNSVAVPFAAVWLPLTALDRLRPMARVGDLAVAAACAVGGVLCLAALAGAVHRAAFLLVVLALATGLVLRLGRGAAGWLAVPLVAGAALLLWGGHLSGVAELMLSKTRAVGLNNRSSEFAAVLDQIARAPLSLLIGEGWGALIANPAVGYWRVSFTHNSGSYFLAKTGVVGFLLATGYMATLLLKARHALGHCPRIALSCLPPLAIALVLHTSYKYLCFSFILTLLLMAANIASKPKN